MPNSVTMVKRQLTYDAYGRISQLILPEGYTYGPITYDGEDEPTSAQLSNGLCNSGTSVITCNPSTTSVTYGVRGEVLASTGQANRQSADGFMCTPSSGGCLESFDSRNGMVYSSGGLGYNYDVLGRNTTVTVNGKSITRSYDADSHLIHQGNSSGVDIACPGGVQIGCDPDTGYVDASSSVGYTWGSNGHPVEYVSNLTGTAATTYWEHWDPTTNAILFETGGYNDVAVPGLGVSNATMNGITVEDRDIFGQRAATHTANEFSVWSQAPASRPLGRYVSALTGGTGSNDPNSDAQLASHVLDDQRPDAFIDMTYGLSFQGARTADVNTGLWTTMDWFGGYPGDVMSQQPYMWNNNNGLMNRDSSGYCGVQVGNGPMVHSPGRPCMLVLPDDFWDVLSDFYFSAILVGPDPFQIERPSDNGSATCTGGNSKNTPPLPFGKDPNVEFASEYRAGANGGYDPVTAWANVGIGGAYDFQRWPVSHAASFRPASNFGVGVYAAGAGWSQSTMNAAFMFTLTVISHNPALYKKDAANAAAGYKWAKTHCH